MCPSGASPAGIPRQSPNQPVTSRAPRSPDGRRRRYRRPLPSELHVTVSRHAAQAFTNVPLGTRLLWSVFLAHGSADDSWRVTTPSCPPCPNRLGCARSDGGCGSLPWQLPAVDRTPRIVPLEASRAIRSGCDPSAFGPVASPTVLPGTVPTSDRKG